MNQTRNGLALLVCSVVFPLLALANCPVPEIRANGEFFKRDVVFTGAVLSERYVEAHNNDAGGWYYRVRVERLLKGPAEKEFTVYTENASNRFPLKQGREYLLFAERQNGRLEIDSCGNSAPLSQATKSLREIQSIPMASDGEIAGWVAEETAGVKLSGIHVVISSRTQVYRVLTDKNGGFHFRAPAGRYRVDFANHEYYVNGGDSFWYEPEHFTLHAGETVTLQLVSVRHAGRDDSKRPEAPQKTR